MDKCSGNLDKLCACATIKFVELCSGQQAGVRDMVQQQEALATLVAGGADRAAAPTAARLEGEAANSTNSVDKR